MGAAYFAPFWLLTAILAYFAILLAAGAWAERRAQHVPQATGRGWVYALSLTVYCTSWTYFGSVGSAASSGMLYATIYLGPTLVMLTAWELVRRMIRLRQRYRISSVVDLITQRYGQSVSMGAFITLVLLLGMLPYIGLQLRALVESFTIITGFAHHEEGLWQLAADELMVALVAVLTCVFGLRRVDTGERQHGLMTVLAIEAMVKLVAFVAVGVFVTWGLFDGFGDLWAQVQAEPALRQRLLDTPLAHSAYLTWMAYLLLSMAAIVFLPRMFHVLVVGNHDERHLLTAMWVFPLYLLLMSFFVLPIAVGGTLLGYPLAEADWLVIRLPFERGGAALTFLAYLGGVSAALGMVMVACTTMAIMFSNHVVLPLIDRGAIREQLRGSLRPIRWAVVFLMLAAAYRFQAGLGNSYLLIQMGLISFAAVLQFVPAGIGGLYWRRGNKLGTWWGLGLGWSTWAYTLLLPAVVHSSAGQAEWLRTGHWGIDLLRPDALFGLDLGSTYANAVFWTLLVNVAGYVVGSLFSQQSGEDDERAHDYTHPFGRQQLSTALDGGSFQIGYATVGQQIDELFARYLPAAEAALAIERVQREARPNDGNSLSEAAYLELAARAERILASTIGAAMARKAAGAILRLSEGETAALHHTLAGQLAELQITPQHLREQVDYFRSLQEVHQAHAQEMAQQIGERTSELKQSYGDLQEREQTIRTIADSAQDALVMVDDLGRVSFWNLSAERIFGWSAAEAIGRPLADFLLPERFRAAHRLGYERFQLGQPGKVIGGTTEVSALRRDGSEVAIELSLSSTTLKGKLHAIGLLRDITERQRAADALLREKQWSESIVRFAPTFIIGLGPGGKIVLFNDYAERLTAYASAEVIGKRWVDVFATPEGRDEDSATIDHALATGEAIRHQAENAIVIRDGSRRLVSWGSQVMRENGEVKMLLSFGVDVTENRRAARDLEKNYDELKLLNQRLEEAQGQLLQSEKMASIGQLAAGVAHEINNPIGFVSSNLQTLKTYSQQLLQLIAAYQAAEPLIDDHATLAEIHALKQALDLDFLHQDLPALICESADGLVRVKKIVADLKDFSHVSASDWQHADLNAGLESTLNVVWNEVKYKARVDKHYATLPPVECLAAQLNQVFMNLIVNAVHAIDENKGMGTITLSTGQQNDWVWIEVEDNGRGMSEEVQRRLFEPFFTTKPVGKGTGLGMSMSYNIVHKHNGRIEVDSVPGRGTRLRVWVPVSHPHTEVVE